jgi:MOSC domain-containing protein YiiM
VRNRAAQAAGRLIGQVVAVHSSPRHSFSKTPTEAITLREGLGVEGDAHCGVTVKHRSRVAADPSQPNLRQVHLLHAELLDDLVGADFEVAPGDLGENITTRGVDLLGLPVGSRLAVGPAVVTVTGLRNPCRQINEFRPGMLKHVLRTDDEGRVQRLAGVMGIVSRSGSVAPGDRILVERPPEPYFPLTRV